MQKKKFTLFSFLLLVVLPVFSFANKSFSYNTALTTTYSDTLIIINCPEDITMNAPSGECESAVIIPIPQLGTDYTDCPGVTITNDYNGTENASSTYTVGVTVVVWTVVAPGENSVTCEQTITVLPTNLNTDQVVTTQQEVQVGIQDTENFNDNDSILIFDPGIPANSVISNITVNPTFSVVNGSCERDIELEITDPSGNILPVLTFPQNTCDGNDITPTYQLNSASVPSSLSGGGNWKIRFRDNNDQNIGNIEYMVSLVSITYDIEIYVDCCGTTAILNCPEDIWIDAPPEECSGAVILPIPALGVDYIGCEGVTMINSINNTTNASDNYPLGLTTVTWTAMSPYGPPVTCQQIVNVQAQDLTDDALFSSEEQILVGAGNMESFEENDSILISDTGVPSNGMINSIIIDFAFDVLGNSCEKDVEIRVTDPAGNISPIFAAPVNTCNGGSHLFQFLLPLASVPVNGGDWKITYRDIDDQNASTEYIVNSTRIFYDITLSPICCSTNDIPEVNLQLPNTVNCHGDTGEFDLVASGGTGNGYEYSFDGGNFTSVNTFSLMAGDYTAIVRDDGGCESESLMFNIMEPQQISLNLNAADSNCGNNDGTLEVQTVGGTPPFEYDIGFGVQTSTTFNDLSEGIYSITVTDINGCMTTDDVIIMDTDVPVIDSIAMTTPNCGVSDGILIIMASGGSGDYQYSINDGTFQPDSTFNNLPSGNYDIVVRDTNSCEATGQAILTDNSMPSTGSEIYVGCTGDNYSVMVNNVLYNESNPSGDEILMNWLGCDSIVTIDLFYNDIASILTPNQSTCDDTLTINAQPTTYTGQWSSTSSSTFDDINASNTIVNNLDIGTNEIIWTVNDGQVCTDTIAIDYNPINLITIDVTSSNCGNNDGSFMVSLDGGTFPFTYDIGNGLPQSSQIFNDLSTGTYNVTVTDANDCTITATTILEDGSTPSIDNIDINAPSCGSNDGIITLTVIGGSIPYTYVWNNGQTDSTAFDLLEGIHMVTVSDANGCEVTATATLTAPLLPMFDLGPDMQLCEPTGIILATGYENSEWSTGEIGEEIIINDYGTYSVTVTEANCEVTDEIILEDVIQFSASTVDTTIARGEYVGIGLSGAANYEWTPENDLYCVTSNCANVRIQPEFSTEYTVTASTDDGCEKDFRIWVGIGGPSVLTPGGVLFFPELEDPDAFPMNQFSVYNRHGVQVFHAQPYDNTWDGTYNGKPLPTGNYYYLLELEVTTNNVIKQRLFISR